MILVSEVVHPGEVHLEFNIALLKVFCYVYPNGPIIYRAEKEQSDLVKTRSSLSNVEFCEFKGYYDPRNFSWLKRITGEIKQIHNTLQLGRKKNVDTYLWTCLFPTGHFFLSLYLIFFRNKNVKHLIVLHGELEFLKSANRKHTTAAFGLVLKLAINLGRRDTQYIVLGNRIKDHLEKYFSKDIIKKIVTVLHPYCYDLNIKPALFKENESSLAFGTIGNQMLSKNSEQIFDLANMLEEKINNGVLNFRTIGKVLPEINPFKNKLVNQLYPDAFVPYSIFENEARKLNFVLFFYSNDSYQLCASGAVFEVIKLGLPIISIYNDYFDWLFEDYGKMGFLCNNVFEMNSLIRDIVDGKLTAEINEMLENIAAFKIKNNLHSIAADLKSKL